MPSGARAAARARLGTSLRHVPIVEEKHAHTHAHVNVEKNTHNKSVMINAPTRFPQSLTAVHAHSGPHIQTHAGGARAHTLSSQMKAQGDASSRDERGRRVRMERRGWRAAGSDGWGADRCSRLLASAHRNTFTHTHARAHAEEEGGGIYP